MGDAVTSWWCEHALLPDGVAHGVLIDVDGERIVAITTSPSAPPGSRRLAGLVVPGLANAHSHAFHRALRSRTQQGKGDFWSWREQMYAVAARLDPDSYLTLATAVYAEMALAGITSVAEFHYLHHGEKGVPYDDPNVMGSALIQAAAVAGIRLSLLDTCYLAGGFGQPLSPRQERFSDGDAAGWASRVELLRRLESPSVVIGAAVHSVRAVPGEQLATVAAWSDLPLHVHLSEQPAENDACLSMYGCTPTALLADAGVLSSRTTAVHATHLTAGDLELLWSSGTGVCLCPTTERDLADGIGAAGVMVDIGIPLSLGSDSHAVIDLFEEARAVELDERLATHTRGTMEAGTLARAAMRHGALGFPDAGELIVGGLADFIAVDLESVRTAGGGATVESLVFSAAATDVTDVVVAGLAVVGDRQHLTLGDVGRRLSTAIAAVVPR
jgi:formiminoglutamate deiminase